VTRREGPGVSDPAATIQKLAVLLEAGLPPDRAWVLLAEDGDAVAELIVSGSDGGDTASRMRALGGAWVDVAVAWRVAQTVGAPLASSLRRFAETLRSAQNVRDDIAVALADPVATARLVAWLPLVAIVLGVALGFDVAVVFFQPVGVACAVGGVALMLIARRWTARLVAKAEPGDRLAGVQGDVVAIALSGGVSVERALMTVRDAGAGEISPDVHAVLALSQRAGVPAVELLRASAAEARRRARTEGRLRAARLGAKLLVPMGVCTLPAFLLLGVAPLLISVLGGASPALAAWPHAP